MILHALLLFQHNHSALFWRKSCKGFIDLLPNLSALIFDAGTWKRCRNSFVKLYLFATNLSAKRVNRQVQRDTVQPRIERTSALKPVNRLPSSKESFLGEIPSIMLIAND